MKFKLTIYRFINIFLYFYLITGAIYLYINNNIFLFLIYIFLIIFCLFLDILEKYLDILKKDNNHRKVNSKGSDSSS